MDFEKLGLLGIFLASFISNATFIFPIPFDYFIILSIFKYNPILICLLLSFSAALGESISYFIGRLGIKAGEKVLKRNIEFTQKIKEKIKHKDYISITILAAIPGPFDIVGVICGILKIDFNVFFLSTLVGKFLRYVFISLFLITGAKLF